MDTRIIPRLDIKGPNLVKGVHLEGLRVLGKPEWFARHYYQYGADELLYMDVVASLYERNSLLEMIEKTSREIFIPLTVGGGLRTIDDIRTVLRAGADKVALNTGAINRPELIVEASRAFGSSTVVVSIEAIRRGDGTYEAYTDNGREQTGVDAIEWAVRAATLGAGEVMVTSIDREGTGRGFDLDLTATIADAVSIPVIACGGAGIMEHLSDAVERGHADAVCLASMLHYGVVTRFEAGEDYSVEGNVEYLKRGGGFSRVESASLSDIKEHFSQRGILCRPAKKETVDARIG